MMFIKIWNKYLPVIRILLKRSVHSEQTLNMNKSDFQRAAGGKKIKFTFTILVVKANIKTKEQTSQLISDFLAALQQDDKTKEFLRKNEVEFQMNSSFQLLIRNIKPAPEPEMSDGGTSEANATPGES